MTSPPPLLKICCVQAELRQPRSEEGLEGVLDLANSLNLTDILHAADLDIRAEGDGICMAESGLQVTPSLVAGSMKAV